MRPTGIGGASRASPGCNCTSAAESRGKWDLGQIDRKIRLCFSQFVEMFDSTGRALMEAAAAADKAAAACLEWERGGEADPVAVTASLAHRAAIIAIEAVTSDEPWTESLDDPQTRRSRVATAAWMLVLAGTDEAGQSVDLALASQLFRTAAAA